MQTATDELVNGNTSVAGWPLNWRYERPQIAMHPQSPPF